MNDTELYHHGVKGQKWGVRKQLKKVGKVLNKQITSKETDEKIKKTAIAMGAAAVGAILATATGGSPILTISASLIADGKQIANNIIGTRGDAYLIGPTPYSKPFRATTPQYIYRNRG